MLNLTRRSCCKLVFAVIVTLVTFSLTTATSAADRPNFILFIGDDISFDDFGCYGHPTLKTPNIDKLASQGLRFTNAYLTTSSCSPTRTSLISGRYPHNTGAPELHMMGSPHLATLPQFPALLREAGYYTAQAGKTHFNGDVKHSFDDIFGGKEGGPGGGGRWAKTVSERPMDKPFFMWFAAYDAHRGWDNNHPDPPEHTAKDVIVPPYQVDAQTTREDLAKYYNEVHRYDKAIGDVVAELKKQGVLDNTVIFVIADNGRPFPRDKTWLYDSGIKTPMVVHWPKGIGMSAVSGSLVSVIDIPPTILELAGVKAPPSFQGVSMSPMFKNPAATTRDFVFAERNWHTQRSHERLVRQGNFVYIKNNMPEMLGLNVVHFKERNSAFTDLLEQQKAGKLTNAQMDLFLKPRPADQLFNVAKDPLQLNNLADDPSHQKTLKQLQAVLAQWTEETGDTFPHPDKMTPDRLDRDTWKTINPGRRTNGGIVPGQERKAHTINRKGPVRAADVR